MKSWLLGQPKEKNKWSGLFVLLFYAVVFWPAPMLLRKVAHRYEWVGGLLNILGPLLFFALLIGMPIITIVALRKKSKHIKKSREKNLHELLSFAGKSKKDV